MNGLSSLLVHWHGRAWQIGDGRWVQVHSSSRLASWCSRRHGSHVAISASVILPPGRLQFHDFIPSFSSFLLSMIYRPRFATWYSKYGLSATNGWKNLECILNFLFSIFLIYSYFILFYFPFSFSFFSLLFPLFLPTLRASSWPDSFAQSRCF